MKHVVVDDHLLRDFLAGTMSTGLDRVIATRQLWTTNLYLLRLCKSVVSAPGGKLTGSWAPEQRTALGRQLLSPAGFEVLPLAEIAFRVAELAAAHRLSSLGAEAVAAAEHLGATLLVWDGDDGPNIRSAATHLRIPYRTLATA